ncbi:MAG: ParA family protein [Oscillospiraceae bacterium]|jgi:chromosome partitioning protein|nr:ParA family protein [Oscillospiraceae bacterium]
MAITIAVVNQKGGVAKTTTSINLSAALGSKGKKVLLVDLDPQGNATTGCGMGRKFNTTVFDIITGTVFYSEAVLETPFNNMSIIPATTELADSEVFFRKVTTDTPKTMFLRQALAAAKSEYDYIIIDCLPSLGTLALNGVTAADSVLIPMQCEPYSLDGLKELLATIRRVRGSHNPYLSILGIVFTMTDMRLNINRAVRQKILDNFPDLIFNSEIPRNIRIAEAPGHGKPIMYYDPSSPGATGYDSLADEVVTRTTTT